MQQVALGVVRSRRPRDGLDAVRAFVVRRLPALDRPAHAYVAKRVVAEILAPGIAAAGDAGNPAQVVMRVAAGLNLAFVAQGELLQAAVRVPRQALRQLLRQRPRPHWSRN